MKRLFLLSKENLDLARAEVLALSGNKSSVLIENILITDAPDLSRRLAFTHSIYRFLFESSHKDLEKKMMGFSFSRHCRKSFAVRMKRYCRMGYDEKFFAGRIWRRLEAPEVSLSSPSALFTFFIFPKKVICALHESDLTESFSARRPHLRPVRLPTSMQPKLARALVNLSGAKKGSMILDPFCGSGGILIEAGLMGLHPAGYDIDDKYIDASRKNLHHFRIVFTLEKRDALTMPEVDYVVTDLPYGKGTKLTLPRHQLYSGFLGVLGRNLRKRAVLVFPHNASAADLMNEHNLKILHHFRIFVHRSLSRDIFVVEN
ncbi:hypothetical protein JW968_04925 [Candidatus Woesearchaeota archaeon]|nr:hypothetical protein [Candidatus Woesearchaeota archaeon]